MSSYMDNQDNSESSSQASGTTSSQFSESLAIVLHNSNLKPELIDKMITSLQLGDTTYTKDELALTPYVTNQTNHKMVERYSTFMQKRSLDLKSYLSNTENMAVCLREIITPFVKHLYRIAAKHQFDVISLRDNQVILLEKFNQMGN